MNHSVSVIIPTFNRCEFVNLAIRSVLEQTIDVGEIIVVDDGSTDGTESTVRKQFPRVELISQTNRGVSHARNAGIQHASGAWIAFLDSDDRWLPKKIEKQMIAIEHNPEYRICHTDEIWIRRGRRVNPMRKHRKSGGDVFERCLPLCVISPSSVLIERRVFDRCGVFDTVLPVCEDYDMWLRICAVYPVLYVDETLIIKMGGHADQLSRRYWGMDRFRINALERILETVDLEPPKRNAVLRTLIQKIEIYSSGAKKRG